ncbi:MAG: 50S ribosomal protein L6 [Candidatus Thermoplasmatota archaeon]|nr:50S ribosomal protein L6 [Candidatus Thermoplasmatota archaeon]
MVKIADIKEEIPIPDGVQVHFETNQLTVKGKKGELTREFSHPKITVSIEEQGILIHCKQPRRKQKALVGTFIAHMKNMMKGVTTGFEYHMKTVYSHFPIKTSVEGTSFVIQNFLGERSPRKADILPGITVDISGEHIIVKGIDKEKVGQTVANIERAAAVKRRDIRVFQDGVYRISKGGGS